MPQRLAAACLCLPATDLMVAERPDALDTRISSSANVIANPADLTQPVAGRSTAARIARSKVP